jgi:hypothetical protein
VTSVCVAFSAALPVAVAGSATPASAAPGQGGGVIVIQGEAPAQANVPTAADPRASGGAYLALDTAQAPPRGGWRATCRVDAAVAGIYHLDAVVTSPAMADRDPKGGSWFELSVNGAPYAEVAKSEVGWAGVGDTPRAWGALVKARIGDVELRRGTNAVSFSVVEPRVSTAPVGYRFLLRRWWATGSATTSVARSPRARGRRPSRGPALRRGHRVAVRGVATLAWRPRALDPRLRQRAGARAGHGERDRPLRRSAQVSVAGAMTLQRAVGL